MLKSESLSCHCSYYIKGSGFHLVKLNKTRYCYQASCGIICSNGYRYVDERIIANISGEIC